MCEQLIRSLRFLATAEDATGMADSALAMREAAAELERLRKDAEHVPDGFVLVPAEPTPEICEAIEEALKQDGFDPVHVGECSKRAIWIDAIDAAIAAEGEK